MVIKIFDTWLFFSFWETLPNKMREIDVDDGT